MTKKQLAALQRILDREVAAYQVRSGRPAPGQHQSEDKVAITDGDICVLLDTLLPELPVGEQADSFARIFRNERESGGHLPVTMEQINVTCWKELAKEWNRQTDIHGVELSAFQSAVQLNVDPAVPRQAVPVGNSSSVNAQFDPQLLVDAAEAVGGKPIYFLGFGCFNHHYPSLLVIPPKWTENGAAEPIALVFPIRR